MRWIGLILLVGIVAGSAYVGNSYYRRIIQQRGNRVKAPLALPPGVIATAEGWTWEQAAGDRPAIKVKAKSFQEVGGKFQLTGMELQLFDKKGEKYDKIESAESALDTKSGDLFSAGNVQITMGVPADKAPAGRLMVIQSSGVHFDSKTGKATTDQPAQFQFEQGDGHAVGAGYDPATRELELKSAAELHWRGRGPTGKMMKVEAGHVTYKERDAKVFLSPWSRLTRETLVLNAADSVVTLKDRTIDLVEAQKAQGTDTQPNRKIEYAADQLVMNFDGDGQMKKVVGTNNARLVSNSATGTTIMTTDRIDLDFDSSLKDSTLQTAVATGHSGVESKPAAGTGGSSPDTRILRSEVIRTKMRAGGEEIEAVETDGAGTLEFVPSAPANPHRWMNGDKIWIAYGEKNQIQSFRTINASTRTEKPKRADQKAAPPPMLTWSNELAAAFEPKSSQMSRLEQTHDFRYEEGTRKANADTAVLDQLQNRITLTTGARVSDDTGATTGDKIVLDQKTGDFLADGNVTSTRLPDKKEPKDQNYKTNPSGRGSMLADDEPLHARAKKMTSTDDNLQIRYEGGVVMWQGADRLQADLVEIDRENEILKAHGNVVSEFLDKSGEEKKPDKPSGRQTKKKATGAVYTVVHAPELTYTDADRIAFYQGGVLLNRPDLRVKSKELKAFLKDKDSDSSLDHAFADGTVEIVATAPDRTRTGTSEHGEYYVDGDKVILQGGQPVMVDSLRGTTQGEQLTWFAQDDRLLVNGVEAKPAASKLKRKKK